MLHVFSTNRVKLVARTPTATIKKEQRSTRCRGSSHETGPHTGASRGSYAASSSFLGLGRGSKQIAPF